MSATSELPRGPHWYTLGRHPDARTMLTFKRVVIVGSAGAGKTRLALALEQLRHLPVIHGDKVFWRPGWTYPDADTFRADVSRLTSSDAWIYDGNIGRLADIVLPRAHIVIWVDQPVILSAIRAYGRTLRHLGRTRPDLAEGCPERFNLSLWGYIRKFNTSMRPRIEGMMREFAPKTPIIVLKGDRAIASFLNDCAGSQRH